MTHETLTGNVCRVITRTMNIVTLFVLNKVDCNVKIITKIAIYNNKKCSLIKIIALFFPDHISD